MAFSSYTACQPATTSKYCFDKEEEDCGRIYGARYALYRAFLGKSESRMKDIILNQGQQQLGEIVEYLQDKELKKEAYNALRNRAVGGRISYNSFIVNEIVGIHSLIVGLINYAKLTWKMVKCQK